MLSNFAGDRRFHVGLHCVRVPQPDGVRLGQHRHGRHRRHREEEELWSVAPAARGQGPWRHGGGRRGQDSEELSHDAGPGGHGRNGDVHTRHHRE